jgi:hypothetical protein
MDDEKIESLGGNLRPPVDDFGPMLCLLEQLNESFLYYKTMIKHD